MDILKVANLSDREIDAYFAGDSDVSDSAALAAALAAEARLQSGLGCVQELLASLYRLRDSDELMVRESIALLDKVAAENENLTFVRLIFFHSNR